MSHIYIYMSVYLLVNMQVYLYSHIYIHLTIHTYINICTDTHTHIYIYMILYTELDELGFNVLISTLFYTKVICQRHTFTENGDVRTPVSSSAVAPPRCVAPWSASAPSSARRSSRRAPRSGRRRSDVATQRHSLKQHMAWGDGMGR